MKRITIYECYDEHQYDIGSNDPDRYSEVSDSELEFIRNALKDFATAQEMLEKAKKSEVFIRAPWVDERPLPKPYKPHVSREETKLNWKDLRKMAAQV